MSNSSTSKTFVPVSWVAGSKSARDEDKARRKSFIHLRRVRSKQRVDEEFPLIKVASK